MYHPTPLPPDFDFESKAILKKLAEARSALSELKGFVNAIPNQSILINALTLQEAKDSSAVENIITTHDELFRAELEQSLIKNIATKEVQNYSKALKEGVQKVKKTGLLKNDCILTVQQILEENKAGYRKLPGTKLQNEATGEMVYEPPQNGDTVRDLMADLVRYYNDESVHPIDPVIKMAIAHHQFESIHPFYDGNGRTGRILNILYLMKEGLLDVPVLYLSRFVIQNKGEYYRYLQAVRDEGAWEEWILFMLEGVRITALDTTKLVREVKALMQEYKNFLRNNFSFYSQDLLNNLFKHPYTKIDFVKDDLRISRQTASKYLKEISEHPTGLLEKVQVGKFSYFVNVKLFALFTHERNLMSKK